jgi:hypothetical protein
MQLMQPDDEFLPHADFQQSAWAALEVCLNGKALNTPWTSELYLGANKTQKNDI